jgi:hypothetical protein
MPLIDSRSFIGSSATAMQFCLHLSGKKYAFATVDKPSKTIHNRQHSARRFIYGQDQED